MFIFVFMFMLTSLRWYIRFFRPTCSFLRHVVGIYISYPDPLLLHSVLYFLAFL